jgi:hypothetical protein
VERDPHHSSLGVFAAVKPEARMLAEDRGIRFALLLDMTPCAVSRRHDHRLF